jgi:hypothetical protein
MAMPVMAAGEGEIIREATRRRSLNVHKRGTLQLTDYTLNPSEAWPGTVLRPNMLIRVVHQRLRVLPRPWSRGRGYEDKQCQLSQC